MENKIKIKTMQKGVLYRVLTLHKKILRIRGCNVLIVEADVMAPNGDVLSINLPKHFLNLSQFVFADIHVRSDFPNEEKWGFVFYGVINRKTICKLHRPGTGKKFLPIMKSSLIGYLNNLKFYLIFFSDVCGSLLHFVETIDTPLVV